MNIVKIYIVVYKVRCLIGDNCACCKLVFRVIDHNYIYSSVVCSNQHNSNRVTKERSKKYKDVKDHNDNYFTN